MSDGDAPVVEVFGKPECTDTARSRALLDAAGVAYRYHDVLEDEELRRRAAALGGGPAVPVVVLPGGVMVEPADDDLASALRRDGLIGG